MIMRHGLRTNFLLNISGMVLPFATALLTVPIYIAEIGAARYGILSIVWILLGYFGFLDFGLSRASANALSRLGHAGAAERSPVLVTSLYLNAALGLAGGAVLFLAGRLLVEHAGLPAELAAEVAVSMPWIAAMLPVALVSGVGAGALESREKFLAANLLTTFGGVLGQVGPVVCAVLIGPSLAVVIPAAFLTRSLSTLLVWAVVLRTERPVSLRSFDRTRVRELMGYGAWVSVSSLISPFLASFDQVLIGGLLGPAAVAHYSVPMSIATRSTMVAAALSKTLFPRLSRLPPAEAGVLAGRAAVTLAYGFASVCGPAMILSDHALQLWVGREFAGPAAPVAAVLLAGAWANGIALIPYTLLQGQGRPDLVAKIHAAEVLPFFAVLWMLTAQFGLVGAAFAWALRTSLDGVVLLRVAGQWKRPLLRALPAVLFMIGCWIVARFVQLVLSETLVMAVAAGAVAVGLGLLLDPVLRSAAVGLLPRHTRLSLPAWVWEKVG